MKAAELFVELGVKGTDKTVQAFTSVKSGLTDMKSMSIETKAAIIGAVYALQQLVSASNNLGTNLVNTASILGMPLKTLQQYNYVAQLVGASNQEMESTFESLQTTMSKMTWGQGRPQWLGRLGQITGTVIDENAGKRFTQHPEELFQLLQQYALKEKDLGLRNQVLSAFHISGNIGSGLMQGMFNPQNLNQAPLYSDKSVKALDAMRKEWTRLDIAIGKEIGNFNVKFGPAIIKDIKEVVTALIKLAEAFMRLDQATGALKLFNAFMDKITGFINELAGTLNESPEETKRKFIESQPEYKLQGYKEQLLHGQMNYNPTTTTGQVFNFIFNGPTDATGVRSAGKDAAHIITQKHLENAGRPRTGQGNLPK